MLQKDVPSRWNKYARTASPNYVAVHRKRFGNKAQGGPVVGPLEPAPRQVVERMVESGMEVVRSRSLCQGARNTGIERYSYGGVFSEDELV